ncbi:agmatinase family protein [Patescibacteria group bacterium]|nr:agmatinase family protein [Patescibacteria group bacterium]
MTDFDPNGAATKNSGVFGFPYTIEASRLVLLPVPWDATASYKNGASNGPDAIIEASKFVELYDKTLLNFYESGIALDESNPDVFKWNKKARKLALPIIEMGGVSENNRSSALAKEVDSLFKKMNSFTNERVTHHLDNNKIVGLIGGDHSISLGAIKSVLDKYPKMGVLQIDAHCDLRTAFEGFTYSHASAMHNVMQETKLEKLVQVGVRGYCEEEFEKINNSKGRIKTFFDGDISRLKSSGETWYTICNNIASSLPNEIYISLDVDGLDPSLCPNTGAPVPGGLSYQDAITLLEVLTENGKRIVGFDLVEVAPGKDGDWDANVGAHLLYKLCGWCLRSNFVD